MGCDGADKIAEQISAGKPGGKSAGVIMTMLFVIFAIGGVFWSAGAYDSILAFHGLVFSLFFIAAILWMGSDYMTKPEAGYRLDIIRFGVVASMIWGVVGFLVGVVIAFQMAFPALNFDTSWLNFGRLRPLHTSAVIFAFGGNVLITTSFYVVQKHPVLNYGVTALAGLSFGAISYSSCWRQPAI